MNAVKLRNFLIAAVVLAVVAIGALMYYASNYLGAEATKTLHAKIDVQLIEQDIEQLKSLERTLEANKESAERARQIVSDSKQYQYQDQIVSDINAYAAASGVDVVGYDFGSANPAQQTTKPLNAPQINGVKSLTVTLTLASPMPFDNYLRFLRSIEGNLTKMQVSGINIAPDPENMSQITNPTVVLIVYVR